MTASKIFIEGLDKVDILCSECMKVRTVKTSSIKSYGKPIKVICPCGNIFYIVFEVRKHYRKSVRLLGTCSNCNSSQMRLNITIIDISQSGICFLLDSSEFRTKIIDINDVLEIQFILDDMEVAVLKTKIIIKHIDGMYFGAEFLNLDEHAKKEIGFFLRA